MPIPIALVGSGNVARALGRRWREAGLEIVGCHGRDPRRVAAALAFIGSGQPLGDEDLRRATVVVLAVADPALPAVVAGFAAAELPRRCSLWLHTSGRYGIDVLQSLTSSGCRVAALHPLCPIPDPDAGHAALGGRFALIESPERGRRLARTLAGKAGLTPLDARIADRSLYHAATALAANGVTALLAVAARALTGAGGIDAPTAARLVADLAGAAARRTADVGAAAALSGPVVRGDAETVRRHRDALAGFDAAADAIYVEVMTAALDLARGRGLDPQAADRVAAALATERADG